MYTLFYKWGSILAVAQTYQARGISLILCDNPLRLVASERIFFFVLVFVVSRSVCQYACLYKAQACSQISKASADHVHAGMFCSVVSLILNFVCPIQAKGEAPVTEEVDLTKALTRQQYEAIVSQALNTHEQDAEEYLKKVQARMDRLYLKTSDPSLPHSTPPFPAPPDTTSSWNSRLFLLISLQANKTDLGRMGLFIRLQTNDTHKNCLRSLTILPIERRKERAKIDRQRGYSREVLHNNNVHKEWSQWKWEICKTDTSPWSYLQGWTQATQCRSQVPGPICGDLSLCRLVEKSAISHWFLQRVHWGRASKAADAFETIKRRLWLVALCLMMCFRGKKWVSRLACSSMLALQLAWPVSWKSMFKIRSASRMQGNFLHNCSSHFTKALS